MNGAPQSLTPQKPIAVSFTADHDGGEALLGWSSGSAAATGERNTRDGREAADTQSILSRRQHGHLRRGSVTCSGHVKTDPCYGH